MRRMTEDEIRCALYRGKWATICTVGKENLPYAIEATYFTPDPDLFGFMINPKGTTLANIRENPNVMLKVTFTSPDLSHWMGVSCFGTGTVITDPDMMARGWHQLGQVMDTDYSRAAKAFSRPDKPSPFLGVTIEEKTGRCSRSRNEPIDYHMFNH